MDEVDVEIWTAWIPQLDATSMRFDTFLDAADREKLTKISSPKRQREFLYSRSILNILMQYYLGQSGFKILRDALGKPYVLSKPLFFNLSHSADCLIFAFSKKCELGVDVEQIRERKSLNAIAKAKFSEREIGNLTTLSGTQLCRMFYQIWVQKEALVKCVGQGLQVDLASFSVASNVADQMGLVGDHPFNEPIHLSSIQCPTSYLACLASKGTHFLFNLRSIKFEPSNPLLEGIF